MSGIQSRIGVTYPSAQRAAASFASGSWIDSTVGDALRATAKRYPDASPLSATSGASDFASSTR